MIILELVKDDTRTKSQATVIVSRLLANHRKFVLSSLNSPSPSNFTMATLKLLTAIVMHGPTLAGELLAAFDFSHKKFGILANRRDKKVQYLGHNPYKRRRLVSNHGAILHSLYEMIQVYIVHYLGDC